MLTEIEINRGTLHRYRGNLEQAIRHHDQAATFAENAYFSDVTFPENAAHYHAAFEGARFREPADFKIHGFVAFAAFDGTTFERRLMLEQPGERADERFCPLNQSR